MPYIGAKELKASDIRRFDVTSSTSATHTLTWTPPTEQSLIVTINGIKQHEDAYSVSGTTLTLSSPLVATDKLEVIGINDIGTTITPAQNSVDTDKIANNAVTTAKIADDQITSAKLANAINITSGNSLTIDSGATITNNGTASGFGGTNTPSFRVTLSADQSIPTLTWTKVLFDTKTWDTDSAFNTTTGEFTVPSGKGGKYVFICAARSTSISDGERVLGNIYINGVSQIGVDGQYSPTPSGVINFASPFIHDLSAGDVVAFYYYQSSTAARNITSTNTYFSAFKLVE